MCDKCRWKDYINQADEMLNDTDYSFAEDTIDGIKNQISTNKHVSGNQKTALDNIYQSKK